MSTTMVPLGVTPAELVDGLALEEEPEPAGELEPAGPDEVAELDGPDELDGLDVAVLLLLLQAATLTTNDAATQPAVHLRMRI